MRLLFTFLLFICFSFSAKSQLLYEVTFPDDQVVYGCGASADTIWPVITKYGNCAFNVGVSVYDQVFYTNDSQGCYKILRRWRTLYWCYYDPSWQPWAIMNPPGTDEGPTVQGTIDNGGFLEYWQVIKILDNEKPEFIDCPDSTVVFCDYSNNDPSQYHNNHIDYCEKEVDLGVTVTDACSGTDLTIRYLLFLDENNDGSMETQISSTAPGAWPIALDTMGNLLHASIDFPTGVGLPYGTHKIKWIADDKCGNETVCEYEFIIKDCEAPTVVCLHGVSVNIMPTGMISITDDLLLEYTFDNCTPTQDIEYAIIKTVQSDGTFPAGMHEVTFDCFELGQQEVQLWVQDAYGNADYCSTYILVQDNMGNCSVSSLKGTVATLQQVPVSGAKVVLQNGMATAQFQADTDAAGYFEFNGIPVGCDLTLSPDLDAPIDNGVNILDALLAGAHHMDILPLTSPYSLLAADVDGSGSLDNNDDLLIAQAAIGVIDQFVNTGSWKFIQQGITFDNPDNPWLTLLNPGFCLAEDQDQIVDFTAIKSGDVHQTAVPQFTQSDDRKKDDDLVLTAPFTTFEAGQTIEVPITAPDPSTWPAFQFAIAYDQQKLQLVDVQPGLIPETLLASNSDEGLVRAGWYEPTLINAQGKGEPQEAIRLVFETLEAGQTDQAIFLHLEKNANLAVNYDLSETDVQLFFYTPRPEPRFYSPTPNPATDLVNLRWELPNAGPVQFTITDLQGRVHKELQVQAPAGPFGTSIELPAKSPTGMLLIRMESESGVITRKVIRRM